MPVFSIWAVWVNNITKEQYRVTDVIEGVCLICVEAITLKI